MFTITIFKRLWKTAPVLMLLSGIIFMTPLPAQTFTVRGSIGKTDVTKVTVYGRPNMNLNALFENINICISVPDQGMANPVVFIDTNYVPSLEWRSAGGNPDVIGSRAYYTFIGNDTSNAVISWLAATDNPIITLSFKEGLGESFVQLNDLTDAGGIGSGGGPGRQSFWYVQANTLGDITDYDFKFYQCPGSKLPLNGGIAAPSAVETADSVALPVQPSPQNTVWQIFPNPTDGRFMLLAGTTTPKGYLRIFDQLGRLVWDQKTALNQAELTVIDAGSLAEGVYVLEVLSLDGSRLFSDRFIVLRE